LTRDKHGEQMRRLRASFLDMVGSLSDSPIKARLLAMDLGQLQVDYQLRRAALPRPRCLGCEHAFCPVRAAAEPRFS
jgi:hypothetical protein